ncbi:hypothetical protein GCM10022293_48810 [Azospirillum formosense]
MPKHSPRWLVPLAKGDVPTWNKHDIKVRRGVPDRPGEPDSPGVAAGYDQWRRL